MCGDEGADRCRFNKVGTLCGNSKSRQKERKKKQARTATAGHAGRGGESEVTPARPHFYDHMSVGATV